MLRAMRILFLLTFVLSSFCLAERFFDVKFFKYKTIYEKNVLNWIEVPIGDNKLFAFWNVETFPPGYSISSFDDEEQNDIKETVDPKINPYSLYPFGGNIFSFKDSTNISKCSLNNSNHDNPVSCVDCKNVSFDNEKIIGIDFDDTSTAVLTDKKLRLYDNEENPFFSCSSSYSFFNFSLASLNLNQNNVTRIRYSINTGLVFTQDGNDYLVAFDYSKGSLAASCVQAKDINTDSSDLKVDVIVPVDNGFVYSSGMVVVHARYESNSNTFVRIVPEVPTILYGTPRDLVFNNLTRNVFIFTEDNLARISLNRFVVSDLDQITWKATQDGPQKVYSPKVYISKTGHLRCNQYNTGDERFEALYVKTNECPELKSLKDCVIDSDHCQFNIHLKDGIPGSCRERIKKENEDQWINFIPTVTAFTPSSASTYGGTTVEVRVNVDLSFSTSVECEFGSKIVNGTLGTSNRAVLCKTPAGLSAGRVNVSVRVHTSEGLVRNITLPESSTDDEKFLFYDCDIDMTSGLNPCSKCYSIDESFMVDPKDSECGWSLEEQKCVNRNDETYKNDVFMERDECILISSISPSEFDETKNVTFIVDFDSDVKWKSGSFRCTLKYQGYEPVSSELGNSYEGNSKYCFFDNRYTQDLPSDKDLFFMIEYQKESGTNYLLYTSQYKPDQFSIEDVTVKKTSCSSLSTCSLCTSRDGCVWSLKESESYECININNKSESGSSIESRTRCPSIDSSSYMGFLNVSDAQDVCRESDGEINVTIPVSNLNTNLTFYCNKNGLFIPAVVVNSSVICPLHINCDGGFVSTSYYSIGIHVSDEKQPYVTAPFSVTNCGNSDTDIETCLERDRNGHCGYEMKSKKGECLVETMEKVKSGTWTNEDLYIVNEGADDGDGEYFDVQSKPIRIPISFVPVGSERQFFCKVSIGDDVIANTTDVDIDGTDEIVCNFDVVDVQRSLQALEDNNRAFNNAIFTGDILNSDTVNVSIGEIDNEDSPYNFINPMTLSVVDCLSKNTTLDCRSCVDIGGEVKRCGWSVEYGQCMSKDFLENKDYIVPPSGSCPDFVSVEPIDKNQGDFTLNLYGHGFYKLAIEAVFVGNKDKKIYNFSTNYVSETQLTVAITSKLPIQAYNISLWLKGRPYTFEGQKVSFTITKPPLPIWVWILIGVGGFLIIAAIFVIIIVVIRRHGGLGTFKFDVSEKPDLHNFAYIRPLQGKKKGGSDLSEEQMNQLAALLKDTSVASAIYKAQDASSTDTVTAAMVYINSYNGCGLKFVETLAKKEVEGTKTVEQLFRESTLATKAASAYLRMMGIEYLWDSLALFINELNYIVKKQQGSSSEAEKPVDLNEEGESAPSSAAGLEAERLGAASGEDLELRRYLFEQRARNLVLCVNNSSGNLPPEIHYLIFAAKQESVNKFGDDAAVSAAIGLLFMRLLCPALHDPQEYALLVDKTHKTALEPSGVLRQQLGFMSTLLLNLAGRRIFQGKDAFLSELNEFVVANMDTIGAYIEAVTTPSTYSESGVAVPQNVLNNSYAAVAEAVESTFPKMKRYLDEQQRSDLAQACGIEA